MMSWNESKETERGKTPRSTLSTWLVWLGVVVAVVLLSGLLQRRGPGPGGELERAAVSPEPQQPVSAGEVGRQEREICREFLRTVNARRSAELEAEQLRVMAYCREVLAAR